MPLSICYFTPIYPPHSEAAAIRGYWFIKSLKDSGLSVNILTTIKTEQTKKLFFPIADNKSPMWMRFMAEIFLGIELFLRIIMSKKDQIYILSSPPFFTIYLASVAARFKRQKYLLDIRDLYPEVLFDLNYVDQNSYFGRLLTKLAKKMYQGAAGIITVTPGLKTEILKYADLPVHFIPNGFDENLFKPSLEKFDKFTVIFHGNLGLFQDVELVLKAAALLQDEAIEFLFVGKGAKEGLIRECNLPNVRYYGHVPYEKIPSLVSQSHLGLCCRIESKIGRSALPVKVFEFLGAGLPVINTPAGEIDEILLQYEGGISLNNTNPKVLAESILAMKENPLKPNRNKIINFSRQKLGQELIPLVHPLLDTFNLIK